MESFLDALNELVASVDDLSGAELIGAMELVKQQLILDLLTDDTDEEEGK